MQLGWEPTIPISVGLKETYFWIKSQIEALEKGGIDVDKFSASEVVVQTDESLKLLK